LTVEGRSSLLKHMVVCAWTEWPAAHPSWQRWPSAHSSSTHYHDGWDRCLHPGGRV